MTTATEEALDHEFKLVEDVVHTHAEVLGRNDGDRIPWLTIRKTFNGGADAAGSIGLSPWETPFSKWLDKVTEEVDEQDTERMRWGRRLEESIGLGISEDTGIPVKRFPFILRSKEWPWMGVDLDFLAPRGPVEVKNVDRFMAFEWDDNAVPLHYAIQGQHANAVTGTEGGFFFPLIGGNEGRAIYVARDEELIGNLVEAERKFWELVKSGTPPAIDASDVTREALKRAFKHPDFGSEIQVPDDVFAMLEDRAAAKALVKEHQERVTGIENQLKLWIGNHEIAKVSDVTAYTWRQVDRAGFVVEPTTYRKLHVPKPKKEKKS